ncbi:MAG TPA: glutathione peroxidase [Chitinophagaceae bacterium]
MTLRQTVLKAVYPLWMWLGKALGNRSKVLVNKRNIQPQQSFYDLSAQLNNGATLSFNTLKGKKLLLVNTASDCGYTSQYSDLQKLYEKYQDKLAVIAFPANDFGRQEKGSDDEINNFCKMNFGITFPIALKAPVIKGNDQQKIFQWLTDKTKNGWNNKPPSWNFSKYLVNEDGVLMNYFDAAISPLSEEVKKAIEQ